MTDKLGNSGRKNGRPAKGDPPRVPYEELDRILVFGEVVTCEDGESKFLRGALSTRKTLCAFWSAALAMCV